MKNIREWNCWTWEFMGNTQEYSMPIVFCHFVWMMIGLFFGIATGAPADALFAPTAPSILWAVVASPTLLGIFGPMLHKVHVLDGLENARYSYPNTSYLRDRAEEYLQLSKEDRKEYPPNILETIKNPLLSDKQKAELDHAMHDFHSRIEARNKARAIISQKSVDITDVLTHLQHGRELLESDIKTYETYK